MIPICEEFKRIEYFLQNEYANAFQDPYTTKEEKKEVTQFIEKMWEHLKAEEKARLEKKKEIDKDER